MNEAVTHFGQCDQSNLRDHLIKLPGGTWSVWRWIGLRSAGFPIDDVLRLSAPDSTVAALQVLEGEEELDKRLRHALATVNGELEALRVRVESDHEEKHRLLVATKRSLQKARALQKSTGVPSVDEAIGLVTAAQRCVELAKARFRQIFDAELETISQKIQEVIHDDRYQKAIIWQNRRAFHTAIKPLMQMPVGARNRDRRHYEKLIANYVQRYCAKNDTIGFFGPLAWARFVDEGEPIRIRLGAEIVASRRLYFESWCVDRLAEKLSEDDALLRWVAPRRLPHFYLQNEFLHLPFQEPSRLPAAHAIILKLCDGERIATQIAAQAFNEAAECFTGEQQVYDTLAELSNRGLITWKLEVPVETYPEQTLRKLLDRVEESALKERSLNALEELMQARSKVAAAHDSAQGLDEALAGLEACFVRLTGTPATRAAGQTYGARTLIYEDCLRDIELEMGPALLQALGPPLTLLLSSARWLTFQLANALSDVLTSAYDELRRESGAVTIDAMNFWRRVQPILAKEDNVFEKLNAEFQQRWAEILSPGLDEKRVRYMAEELRPRIAEAFAAPKPGWWFARNHSPDLMLAAASADAIRRGEYEFVLGEIHQAMNSLSSSVFVAQHPSPDELLKALEADLPEHSLMPISAKRNLVSRTLTTLLSPKCLRLVWEPDSNACGIPAAQAVPIAELVVEHRDGRLVAVTRDGRLCFDAIGIFASLLTNMVIRSFKLFENLSHSPRLTIDRLVISRESWNFPAESLGFANKSDEAECFLEVRRWTQAQSLPRFVFVRVPQEIKPFYVDFDSPVYVSILAKAIKGTNEKIGPSGVVTISEMLPAPNQVWLPDADGRLYSSEFRVVSVDPEKG